MQRLSGMLLMLSGVALGSYVFLPPEPQDLAGFTDIALTPPPATHMTYGREDRDRVRTFSPASPVFREVLPPAAPSVAAAPKPSAWTAVVTEQSRSQSLRSSRPNDALTRVELARDLQRELKRVGCYAGEVTGVWNAATRNAMADFIDRANATLPIDQPDYVLLTLVQKHGGMACGAACPSGQSLSETGRCVPNTILAQASKKSKRLEEARIAEATRPLEQQPLASSAPERLPWLDGNGQPITAPAARSESLPGRMAIGGPNTGMEALAPSSGGQRPPAAIDGHTETTNIAGSPDPNASSKFAALTSSESDSGASDGASIGGDETAGAAAADIRDAGTKRLKPAQRADPDDAKARSSYWYAGKPRKGDPRPGTMRYNLVQALGGIY